MLALMVDSPIQVELFSDVGDRVAVVFHLPGSCARPAFGGVETAILGGPILAVSGCSNAISPTLRLLVEVTMLDVQPRKDLNLVEAMWPAADSVPQPIPLNNFVVDREVPCE